MEILNISLALCAFLFVVLQFEITEISELITLYIYSNLDFPILLIRLRSYIKRALVWLKGLSGTSNGLGQVSNATEPPSLSSLPTGLKLCILDYCLPGAFSALSRVNQDFHRISQDFDMTTILLKSEYFHESYLRANHLYPCYSCCRLLPSSYFADDEKINERSYAGQGAHLRGCLSCRLIGLSHLSRDFVLYRGSYEFRCLSCNRFCGIKIFNSACRPTLLNNPSDHLPLWKRKRAEFYNAWVRSRLQEDTTRSWMLSLRHIDGDLLR